MENSLVSYVETQVKKSHPKGLLPKSDTERVIVGGMVGENMKASNYTLTWTSGEVLTGLSERLRDLLNLGGSRYSMRSQEVDVKNFKRSEIKARASRLKSFMRSLHGDKAAALMFGEFGFIHSGNKYEFRGTEAGFVQSILECLNACEKYQILSPDFGKPYWDEVYSSFSQSVLKTRTQTGEINESKADKEDVRRQIDRILKSVSLMIQAENPDNYKDILMQWGFKRN